MILNSLQKNTTKQKIINISIIFVIFLGLIVYFAIISSISTIKNLNTEIIQEKINNKRQTNLENNIIDLSKKITKIENSSQVLDEIFISKNRELEFITILEGIANKNKVNQKISMATPENKKQDEKTKVEIDENNSSPLTISLTGNYHNVINYISEISTIKQHINIEGLDFSKNNIENNLINKIADNNQIISLNMSAKIYWK